MPRNNGGIPVVRGGLDLVVVPRKDIKKSEYVEPPTVTLKKDAAMVVAHVDAKGFGVLTEAFRTSGQMQRLATSLRGLADLLDEKAGGR